MYVNGQVLGAATTTGATVAALPLTSGNTIFQLVLIATAAVAFTVLIVRIIKLVAQNSSQI
jgi:hypothetical protein